MSLGREQLSLMKTNMVAGWMTSLYT